MDYPLDELTKEQRSYVLAVRDVNALNAAYAGRAEFRAEGLPAFEEVFPDIAAGKEEKEEIEAGDDSMNQRKNAPVVSDGRGYIIEKSVLTRDCSAEKVVIPQHPVSRRKYGGRKR